MSKLNIPESWATGTISDTVKDAKSDIVDGPFGSRMKSSEYKKSGTPILRLQNIQRNEFIHKNFMYISKEKSTVLARHSYKANDIIITKLGAPLGKACIVPNNFPEGNIVADLVRLRVNEGVFDTKFLTYQINSAPLISQFEFYTKGATRPRVNLTHIRSLSIGIPPLEEQRRIVQKIEYYFEKIEATEANLKKIEILLGKYRESLLAKAFRGELVEQDPNDESVGVLLERIRKEKNFKAKKAKLDFQPIADEEKPFNVPQSWSWVRLGELEFLDILSDIQDGNHGEIHPKASDYVKSGVPFVMANNIVDNRLALDTCKFIKKSQSDALRIGFAKAGDILLTHKGTVGSCAIVPELPDYIMLTPQVTYYRVGNSKFLLNEFLYFIFQSPFFQSSIKRISKQATRDYVGITRQKDLIIPLPPISEQKRLIRSLKNIIDYLNGVQKQVSVKRKKIKPLRESILQKAFEGRLVPQIPSEGTGHELLAKILAEKEKAIPKAAKTKTAPRKKKK